MPKREPVKEEVEKKEALNSMRMAEKALGVVVVDEG